MANQKLSTKPTIRKRKTHPARAREDTTSTEHEGNERFMAARFMLEYDVMGK